MTGLFGKCPRNTFIDRYVFRRRDFFTRSGVITATKNVTINESFFRGHFPNNPVMPGVLIIETLAQAASILILKSPEFENKTAYLGAIHQAKFRKVVRPGDVLKLHIVMEKKKSNMGIVKATALVEGKKACTAELMFAVYDRDEKI